MSAILNIETSTDVCSVGIAVDGQMVSLMESQSLNSHTEKLTLLIQACAEQAQLALSDLDAIAVSDGPGSYTSLRIGASTAKAMAYALNKPLITIDSLHILAHGVSKNLIDGDAIIISMIDARRNEVYAAVYNHHYKELLSATPLILDENPFKIYLDNKNKLYICGNGALKYYNQHKDLNTILQHETTSARYMEMITYDLFKNQQFSNVSYFIPDYIKSPNITKSNKKLF